jgi:hypothetical protein
MEKKIREGFNFYRSYYDVFNLLESDKDKLVFITSLLEKQFEGIDPQGLKGNAKFAYISQQHSINKQVKGWEDKVGNPLEPTLSKGGKQPLNNPPTQQVQVQGKEQVQGGEDVDKSTTTKTLEQRQIDFGIQVKGYVERYGEKMCKDFFAYWTEKNTNGKKMRFEMEKVFDLPRRLATWNSRQKDFSKEPEQDQLVVNVYKAIGK